MPLGNWAVTCCKRSLTICRAKYIDTESSKTTVMIESPSFERERTSCCFGIPIILLDGIRDELLDLSRWHGGSFGHDRHLIVGEVGKSFNGHGVKSISTCRNKSDDKHQHDPA